MFWDKPKNYDIEIENLKAEIRHLKDLLSTHAQVIASFSKDFNLAKQINDSDLTTIRQSIQTVTQIDERIDLRLKKVTTYFHDAMDVQDQSVTDRIAGLLKHVSHKMELLLGDGDKSKMINELLKRVAYLEGVKEIEGKMKSAEDVERLLHKLTQKSMKFDREEKTDPILNAQMDILYWIIGEENNVDNS